MLGMRRDPELACEHDENEQTEHAASLEGDFLRAKRKKAREET